MPRVRTPHPNKAYKMNETPYLKNIKLALEQATTRPVTVFEKQRYLVSLSYQYYMSLFEYLLTTHKVIMT